MIRTRTALGVALILISAIGCRQARAGDLGMPDSTFVATLNELRRVETDTSLDVTMRDSTRRMILRRHKVTSTQLEKGARILAQTPAHASDLWRQIESVPRRAISKAKPVPGPPPGNNHPATH
jgi:hypothetical protein